MNDNSAIKKCSYLARLSLDVLRRPRHRRDTVAVTDEYNEGWRKMGQHLNAAKTLDEWLTIPHFDEGKGFFNIDDKLTFTSFNSSGFYRETLVDVIRRHFPNAKSITEFGAGVGRNLLYLKREMPQLDVYGYELCLPGVEIAEAAAEKFGISAQYEPLDYLNDPAEKYVFPVTDVAFTMFSLEQVSNRSSVALRNILPRVRMGSVHLEPVPENYPLTYRGILARLNHWKVDYLSGFDRASKQIAGFTSTVEHMRSAHNSLMFPSVYILRSVVGSH